MYWCATWTVRRTHSGSPSADAGVAVVAASAPLIPAVRASTAMSFFMFTPPARSTMKPTPVVTWSGRPSYGRIGGRLTTGGAEHQGARAYHDGVGRVAALGRAVALLAGARLMLRRRDTTTTLTRLTMSR